jgi:hypothetical protein
MLSGKMNKAMQRIIITGTPIVHRADIITLLVVKYPIAPDAASKITATITAPDIPEEKHSKDTNSTAIPNIASNTHLTRSCRSILGICSFFIVHLQNVPLYNKSPKILKCYTKMKFFCKNQKYFYIPDKMYLLCPLLSKEKNINPYSN